MTRGGRLIALSLPSALSACPGSQNVFGGQGAEGANFILLFAAFLVVCAIMYLIVLAGLAIALRRGRNAERTDSVDEDRHQRTSPRTRSALMIWTGLVAVGLTGLTVASFFADRSNARNTRRSGLALTVTGNQWWWNVQYDTSDPSKSVRTANEIHLPVNVSVHVTLKSNDVIHSFWVPNLAGKQDLIPGRVTDVELLPTRTGVFRGQCAEFCGVQHTHMALDVIVEPLADFQRWYAHQLALAPTPAAPLQMAGYRYVVSRECSSCHNIAGTPASGQIAPDLTHVASRRSLAAAGTLPLNRGNLYGWIADPQSQKPGNRMPTIDMDPKDMHAVVAYLETLK
jgi:cytochrome c oxidase subunit 2